MKTYNYEVYCLNCGISELCTQEFGNGRPSKKECTNCGCLADTRTVQFNKNIHFNFPYDNKPQIITPGSQLIC